MHFFPVTVEYVIRATPDNGSRPQVIQGGRGGRVPGGTHPHNGRYCWVRLGHWSVNGTNHPPEL
jgi:hypothetical protein